MTPTIPPRARAMGAALITCLALAACASTAEPSVHLIDERSVATLPEGAALALDLRDPDVVHVLDRRALDDAQIYLICPDGAGMGLADWLREQGPEYERSDTLVLATGEWAVDALFDAAREPCAEVCRACPDGVTVCRSRCGAPSLATFGPGRDPLDAHDPEEGEPAPPPQEAPTGSTDTGGDTGGAAGTGAGGSPGGHPGR